MASKTLREARTSRYILSVIEKAKEVPSVQKSRKKKQQKNNNQQVKTPILSAKFRT